MESARGVDDEPTTTNAVILRELDKIVRRLDTIDDKVTAIHAVNERIKKEASFRRTYRDVPLYGGGDEEELGTCTEEDEEEESASGEPILHAKRPYCACCIIT